MNYRHLTFITGTRINYCLSLAAIHLLSLYMFFIKQLSGYSRSILIDGTIYHGIYKIWSMYDLVFTKVIFVLVVLLQY